jgi:hypothetical protein
MIDLMSDHREVWSTPSCTLRGWCLDPPVGISTEITESAAIAALQRPRQKGVITAVMELSSEGGEKVNEEVCNDAIWLIYNGIAPYQSGPAVLF